MGVTSQLLSFNNLVFSIGTFGIPMGLAKYVSEWEKEGRWNEIRGIINTFIKFMLPVGFLIFFLTVILSKQISRLILDSDTFSVFMVIISFSLPISLATAVFEASLRGLKKYAQYVKITVLVSAIPLAISVVSVWLWDLTGVAVSILISSVFSAIVYFYYFRKNDLFRIRELKLLDFSLTPHSKLILKIGLVGLAELIVGQIALLVIRSSVVRYFGMDANGIYQSVSAISNNYLSLFFMSIGVYVLPVLSEYVSTKEMNDEINNIFRITLLTVVPIIIITYVFRDQVILLFFSSKFGLASDLFIYSFIGDYFKALSWVLGSWLIPRSRIGLWLTLSIVYNLLYLMLFFILVNLFFLELKSIVIAYFFVNSFHFFVNLFFIKRMNSFFFARYVYRSMLVSTLCLVSLLIISSINVTFGYVFVLPVLLIWVILSVQKQEVVKAVQIVKFRLYR